MKTGRSAFYLYLALASTALAEPMPADCATLAAGLQTIGGWSVTSPPAGSDAGWCVFDHAAFKSGASDLPDLKADRLRLRGEVEGEKLVGYDLDLKGLRLRPGLNATAKDDPIAAIFRLQSADLDLSVRLDPATGLVEIRDVKLVLSGGTEIGLSADIAGAGLSPAALASGRLTALTLDWRLDGRLLRPVMEAVGADLRPDATGSVAVDAARAALRQVTDALPGAMLSEESRTALDRAVTALPVGRGRLLLSLVVADGLGASRLVLAGLADDPLGAETLADLFAGARLDVTWTPGLAP